MNGMLLSSWRDAFFDQNRRKGKGGQSGEEKKNGLEIPARFL